MRVFTNMRVAFECSLNTILFAVYRLCNMSTVGDKVEAKVDEAAASIQSILEDTSTFTV